MPTGHIEVKTDYGWIDKDIAPFVILLNEAGLRTIFSCQGVPGEKKAHVTFTDFSKVKELLQYLPRGNSKDVVLIGCNAKWETHLAIQESHWDFYVTLSFHTIHMSDFYDLFYRAISRRKHANELHNLGR
jgi:hypothetical protein